MMRRRTAPVAAPGCDDAPLRRIRLGDKPKPVTIIMPYYECPEALAGHLERWASWPTDIRAHMQAIIVDDGSPVRPAGIAVWDRRWPVQLRVARIEVDVRWNWLAARNLGFSLAPDGWCVVTDMDHRIPEETARALVYGEHIDSVVYRFSRTERGGEAIAPHPNSWFMTRARFWRIGGYDEALSGFYGTDGEYRRRVAACSVVRIMTDVLERWEHEGDASATRYQRKQPEDAAVRRMVAARGAGWKPLTLSFPWRMVIG